ncbi:hypothetical protein [Cribrihabitans neustonicus]|uniref:hypothetical protein n=1 Tax=Cribrihabitans neustonicus TaxID=1429085 RepID=UPI003B5B84D4
MAQTSRPKPHRKFIALILAVSLAITGFSAAPARANEDVAKVLAGLALLGIIGAVINDRKDDHHSVSRAYTAEPQYGHGGHHYNPKPLPQTFRKYDLPARCLRHFPAYSSRHALVGQGCLDRHYGYKAHSLPQSCRVTFWNGKRHKSAFKPHCLRDRGYRLVQH